MLCLVKYLYTFSGAGTMSMHSPRKQTSRNKNLLLSFYNNNFDNNNKNNNKNNNNNNATKNRPLAPKTGNAGTLRQRPFPVLAGALFSTLPEAPAFNPRRPLRRKALNPLAEGDQH